MKEEITPLQIAIPVAIPKEPGAGEEGGYYYELFKFFSDNHNLTLVDTEIQDIIHAVNKFQNEK